MAGAGEDDNSFERQSALFALAVSDCLLVNMWAKDVGREAGAGKPLLKTIFQVRHGALWYYNCDVRSPAPTLHAWCMHARLHVQQIRQFAPDTMTSCVRRSPSCVTCPAEAPWPGLPVAMRARRQERA